MKWSQLEPGRQVDCMAMATIALVAILTFIYFMTKLFVS